MLPHEMCRLRFTDRFEVREVPEVQGPGVQENPSPEGRGLGEASSSKNFSFPAQLLDPSPGAAAPPSPFGRGIFLNPRPLVYASAYATSIFFAPPQRVRHSGDSSGIHFFNRSV